MRNAKIITVLSLLVIVFSIILGYVIAYYVYKEYKDRTADFDKQIQAAVYRVGKIESNLNSLYSALDENTIERKKVLSKLDDIRGDIQDWKIGYKATVSNLRASIKELEVDRLNRLVEKLQDEVNRFKMTVQDLNMKFDASRAQAEDSELYTNSIDLGKISVKKEDKK